jgi:hypothetical protein
MTDDDELTERAAWVLRHSKALKKMGKQILLLGPAAGADLFGEFRDAAGEMIDVARHLAEDPRLPAKHRRFFHRSAEWMNKFYAELSEVCEELRAQEGADPDG